MSRPNGTRPIRSARLRYIEELRARVRPADGRGRAGLAATSLMQPPCSSCRPAFAFVRSVRHKPRANARRRRAPGGMVDALARRLCATRARRPALRPADAVVAPSARRRELATRVPGTQIILNHTGLPADRSAEGIEGWQQGDEEPRRLPERRGQDLRPRPAGQAWTVEANREIVLRDDRLLRRRALHVREQFPGRQPLRDLRHDLRRLPARSCATFRLQSRARSFTTTPIRIYSMED